MSPALMALVVHDLKNELGALEASLATLAARAETAAAASAHRQCAELRQRFIQFLTLYGPDAELRAHASDESPSASLLSLLERGRMLHPDLHFEAIGLETAPAFWYFDARLVRLALDAALHNAGRFAQKTITLQALERDGFLVLRIDDDGPGPGAVDPQALHATGLGTALCEAVGRAHHCGPRQGRARLFARPGGGARFELWLA